MEKLDWSTFNKRININSEKDKIFDSWCTQDNLEKWFLSQAQFFREDGTKRKRNSFIEKDDTYEWSWYGSDFISEGKVLETNNKDYLKFTFLGCLVEVKVKIEENTNILQITQSEIPLDEESRMNYYVGCARGWTFYAANLKSILEGGIDLRNRDKNLVDVINT